MPYVSYRVPRFSVPVKIADRLTGKSLADELEEEWRLCYSPTDPYLVPQAEETGDLWYKGEDCANPSQIAPKSSKAILPAADGSLALKHDVVLPSAPEDRRSTTSLTAVCSLTKVKGARTVRSSP